jgi:ATP-binding protein involved in chromosome partitioning
MPIPGVRHLVAVGSGKGGVGKTTVAVNLSIALAKLGRKVGLLDADVYGPNVPLMMGAHETPRGQGDRIGPLERYGVKLMSMGFLNPGDKPLVWRGPMLHSVMQQFLRQVDWGELDYLIIDLPPGTGDVPLTLCQLLPLTGAVVVATPQQVALDDALRAINMFIQLQAPVLGLVENMSYFIDPAGGEHDIFGRGGTEKLAQQMKLAYLGGLPLFTELRVNSDSGQPEKNFDDNPRLRDALQSIVRNLAGQVSVRNMRPSGPVLNVT